MIFNFENIAITGILSVLPENEVSFEEELDNYNFSVKNSLKLKKILGFNKRRVVEDPSICASDLALFGINHLIDNNLLKKEEISALIFVSLTPDYVSPPTSNVMHGKLGLDEDVYCVDINQGCAGYVLGLYQAFSLINNGLEKKVVLVNADISTQLTSSKDRSTRPLFGDAAAITIVERKSTNQKISGEIKNNGKNFDSLIIPAGGGRTPSTTENLKLYIDNDGNERSLHHSHMKGDLVYNFTVNEVVETIEYFLSEHSSIPKKNLDTYMFHQPNKFILKNMAAKLGLTTEEVPNNIVEKFGNSNGSSIPLNICFNLNKELEMSTKNICLSGFGVGLAWNVMTIEIGMLNFCEIIEF